MAAAGAALSTHSLYYTLPFLQVAANAQRILTEISREEAAFSATLSKGQKLLDEMLAKALNTAAAAGGSNGGSSGAVKAVLPGADAFLLYDSFGFPLELTQVGPGGGGHTYAGAGGLHGRWQLLGMSNTDGSCWFAPCCSCCYRSCCHMSNLSGNVD